eukprot:scaffold66174_cov49-Prasinocladus_malaysianus.AAC.2
MELFSSDQVVSGELAEARVALADGSKAYEEAELEGTRHRLAAEVAKAEVEGLRKNLEALQAELDAACQERDQSNFSLASTAAAAEAHAADLARTIAAIEADLRAEKEGHAETKTDREQAVKQVEALTADVKAVRAEMSSVMAHSAELEGKAAEMKVRAQFTSQHSSCIAWPWEQGGAIFDNRRFYTHTEHRGSPAGQPSRGRQGPGGSQGPHRDPRPGAGCRPQGIGRRLGRPGRPGGS